MLIRLFILAASVVTAAAMANFPVAAAAPEPDRRVAFGPTQDHEEPRTGLFVCSGLRDRQLAQQRPCSLGRDAIAFAVEQAGGLLDALCGLRGRSASGAPPRGRAGRSVIAERIRPRGDVAAASLCECSASSKVTGSSEKLRSRPSPRTTER